MSELALLGGTPVIDIPLPLYRAMGPAETAAVARVMESGCLSGFYGSPGPQFLGGPNVQALEAAFCRKLGTAHAVSVNSATSGLIAAMGAIGLSPGDEVILPPYTMSATAMAPLFYGGIPVFADIEAATFCIDPAQVVAEITPKTKAIIAVNLFGHPARLHELRDIADAHGLYLVEDNAQAPLASENGRACGTVGHIGVFSFNFHKHIHTGEGGMCVTDDAVLAHRLRLIRNHGENSVSDDGADNLGNIVGHNFRLTEIQAAIGVEQFGRIDDHVARRESLAQTLTSGVSDLAGLTPPVVRAGCRHNYYCWTLRFNENESGVKRSTFSKALAAEGFPHFVGYVKPLYFLPLFTQRRAIGREGFPFTLTNRRYGEGLCPVSERMHAKETILFEPCAWSVDAALAERLVRALRKVHRNLPKLADWQRRNA